MITQGICEDGAAILDDGKKLTVDEIVSRLNGVMQMLGSSAGTGNSASSQGSSSGYGGAQQPKATNQPPIDDDFDQEVPF